MKKLIALLVLVGVVFVLAMPFIFNKSVSVENPHALDADENFILHEWAEPRDGAGPDWDYNLKPVQVSERVWCFFGAMAMPTKENAGDMSNSCYIKGDSEWITWDTGPSYVFAKQAYAAMKKIADYPVSTVIVSHEHDDHWLGNNYYKEVHKAVIKGPESININYHKGDQTRMIKALYQDAIRETELVPVDTSFEDTTEFEISGVKMEYVKVGYAHSEEDWFLYLPDDKVVLVADVVMNGRVTSNRDGIVVGQLEALKAINSREWNHLVPGHGFITDKTAADESVQYFTLMKDRVLEQIEEELDPDFITKVVRLNEFRDKDLYYLLSPGNVFRSYEELEMYDGDDDEDDDDEEDSDEAADEEKEVAEASDEKVTTEETKSDTDTEKSSEVSTESVKEVAKDTIKETVAVAAAVTTAAVVAKAGEVTKEASKESREVKNTDKTVGTKQDVQIYTTDNKDGKITGATIEKAFKDAGFVIAGNNDMNVAFKSKFKKTNHKLYRLFTVYDKKLTTELVKVSPKAALFAPLSMSIYMKTGSDDISISSLSINAIAKIVGIPADNKHMIEYSKLLKETIAKALPNGKFEETSYKILKAEGELISTFTTEMDEEIKDSEAIEEELEGLQEELEGSLETVGFVIAGFSRLGEDFAELKYDKYDFFDAYSICKLPVIFEVAKTHPEAGAYAPCTLYMYKEKGSNVIELAYPSVYNWISSLDIKDEASVKVLVDAQNLFIKTINEVIE